MTGFGSDSSKKGTVLIDAQAYLPGGTVFAEGYGQLDPNGPAKFTLPVVGGTGTYANVRVTSTFATSETASRARQTSSSTYSSSPCESREACAQPGAGPPIILQPDPKYNREKANPKRYSD